MLLDRLDESGADMVKLLGGDELLAQVLVSDVIMAEYGQSAGDLPGLAKLARNAPLILAGLLIGSLANMELSGHVDMVQILRKGMRVVHHFAHKPPVTCSYSQGETRAHMEAKAAIFKFFQAKGMRVEVEYPLQNGKQRADVIAWGTQHTLVFEVQHSPIAPEAIAKRTEDYSKQGLPVIWLPLLNAEKLLGVACTQREKHTIVPDEISRGLQVEVVDPARVLDCVCYMRHFHAPSV